MINCFISGSISRNLSIFNHDSFFRNNQLINRNLISIGVYFCFVSGLVLMLISYLIVQCAEIQFGVGAVFLYLQTFTGFNTTIYDFSERSASPIA